jgi:hypothetical protein
MRAALPLLIVLGAGATAHADDNANEIALGAATRTLRSSSANAVTDQSLGGGELSYGRSLGITLMPHLELWAGAGFSWGGASGTMFQTLSTEVDSVAFTLGARARYRLHPRLAVGGRVDLGTARASLTLRDGVGHSASDAHWGATSSAAISVDLLALVHRNMNFGVRLELGYVATEAIELTGRSESADASTIVLDMMEASLGHLDLGGPYFSASMISQF